MSIYIKNMEMPTSCVECDFMVNCDDCEGWECACVPLHQPIGYLKDLLTDKRRGDCPLVPVPPHGDLVDAQEILRIFQVAAFSTYEDYEEAYDTVDNAPTVIPAEPKEETV